MRIRSLLTVGFVAALTLALGGATLRSKTPSISPVVHVPAATAVDPSRDGDYVWDPVDRYWERDRNGR